MTEEWPNYRTVRLVGNDSLLLSFAPPVPARGTRWFWFRPAEALVAELDGHPFSLAALNMRLRNLYQLLSSGDMGNNYIRGFNVKLDRNDPDPPITMLLVLLGLGAADLTPPRYDAGYSLPETYPVAAPASLADRQYDSWQAVFARLRAWTDATGVGFNGADIALHFIPGAVRIVRGSSLKVQGSGFYVAQYREEAGDWKSYHSYKVLDYRNRELHTETRVTQPGIEATLSPINSALTESFNVYEIAPEDWVVPATALHQIESALRIVFAKELVPIPSGAGAVRNWRAGIQRAYLVIDEADLAAVPDWRPNLGTIPGEPPINETSRALLHVYLYQLDPQPRRPPGLLNIPRWLDLVAPESFGLDPLNPLPREFAQVLDEKAPIEGSMAPWIAPVITNRLRAAHWLDIILKRLGVSLSSIREQEAEMRGYRLVGPHDAVMPGYWLIMPYFFERRVLFRPDGSINLKWLREAYLPFQQGHRTWQAYANYFLTQGTANHIIWYYWKKGERYKWSYPDTYPIDKVSAVLLATVDDPLDKRVARIIATSPALPFRAVEPVIRYSSLPRLPPVRPAPAVLPAAPGKLAQPPPAVPGAGTAPVPPAPAPVPPATTATPFTPLQALALQREVADWIGDTVVPLERVYTDMLARGWQVNPQLEQQFQLARRAITRLLDTTSPLDTQAQVDERVRDASESKAFFTENLSRASLYINTALRGEIEAKKQLRVHALSPAVEKEKDDLYARLVKDATRNLISNDQLLEIVRHKLQASSVDALVKSGQRSGQEQLVAIGEWWKSVLSETEMACKRFAALAVHSQSEALRNEVDRAIDFARFTRITWNWPADVGSAINSNLTEIWDDLWRTKVTEFVTARHIANVDAYTERLADLFRRVDGTGALTAAQPLLTVFRTYDDSQPVPDRVPAFAAHPQASKSILERLLKKAADENWPSDQLLDELRKQHLDCIINLASGAASSRADWLDVSKRFSACYIAARRIEEYLSALLRTVTSSTGWFSYARRRHWAYDTKDARSDAVPASIVDWHGALVWSIAEVKKEGPTRVSKGELGALEAAQNTFSAAFRAARSIITKIEGTDFGGIALRFLLCGTTLESAWGGLETDKQLLFLARRGFERNLPRPVAIDNLLGWFATASGELLGDARPAPGQPYVKVSAGDLARQLADIDREVLQAITGLLPSVSLWDRTTGAPADWWSASGSWSAAYPGQRTTTVLQPRTDGDDDLHGATIALVEFFAYGDTALWKRFVERPSLKGRASKNVPVQRPNTRQLEQAALDAASTRAGYDARSASKVWESLATVRAQWYTYAFLTNTAGELTLGNPDPNLPHGHIVPRNDVIRDPTAEGTELVYLLRQELAVLIDGCVRSTYGRSKLIAKAPTKVLPRVVERLLSYLDGSVSSRAEFTKRLGWWVYQSSTAGSRDALPDIDRPAQWTQIVYLLSRDEGAMASVSPNLSAEARLASAQLATALTEVLKSLVNRLEGNVRQQLGTRVDPDRVPPTYPETTSDALASPMPRIAWPLAAAQQIARTLEKDQDSSALLHFFWSTLFRPDTDEERPVPFFTAAMPENPDERRTSGFSAQALADYSVASEFGVQLSVVSPARLQRLQALWTRSGRTDTPLKAILSNTLRFMFVLDCDNDEIPDGLLTAADKSRNNNLTYQHTHERAAYCCVRTQEYTGIAGAARWKVLSAWTAHDRSFPGRNTVPVVHTTDLTGYFNPLYPTSGSRRGRTDEAYVRLNAPGRDESLPKESTPIVLMQDQLVAICARATLLFENTALLDWYAHLERGMGRDDLTVLNGSGDTLGAAVVRDISRDLLRPERLDMESARMRGEWDKFKIEAMRLYDGDVRNALGAASVDGQRDNLVAKLDAWRGEWDTRLSEARLKALNKLAKLVQRKNMEEVRMREAADKIVADFVSTVDEKDSRTRQGFIATLVGLALEAQRRGMVERERARALMLA